MICGCYGQQPWLLSGRVPASAPKVCRRVPNAMNGGHEQDWIRACKESPENRVEGTSNFAYSGPFNEMVLLGVLAIRLQGLNKKLMWDAQNMRFTNISSSDVLKIVTSDDFKVIDGHPYFDTKYAEFNALEAANEYIRHTYREGWSLPENAGISMKRYIILALCTVMLLGQAVQLAAQKADWKVGIQTWTFHNLT